MADHSNSTVVMTPRQQRRALLDYWFWRGLTGLVFAGTVGMLFVRPA